MLKQTLVTYRMVEIWIARAIYFFLYFIALFVVSLGEVTVKSVYFPLLYINKTIFQIYSFFTGVVFIGFVKSGINNISTIIVSTPKFISLLLKSSIKLVESFVFWVLFLGISLLRFFRSLYFRYFIYGFVFC